LNVVASLPQFGITILSLALLLSACAQQAPVSNTDSATTEPVVVVSEQQLKYRRQLAQLLAKAAQRLSRDRLMVPAGDSAHHYFWQVLRLEEGNAQALEGMAAINTRYLQLAQQAFQQGAYNRAQRMLTGASRVSTPADEIEVLRLRYRAPVLASNEFLLQLGQLDARGSALLNYLQVLTDKLLAADSRLLIVARNDAEGRWLYQQMRQLAGGHRLRGDIKVGPRPRIILIDLEAG